MIVLEKCEIAASSSRDEVLTLTLSQNLLPVMLLPSVILYDCRKWLLSVTNKDNEGVTAATLIW